MQRARRELKEGEPTFFFLWWRSHTAELPTRSEFLRAILCNVPNSCPPERAFSILNGSFGGDLKNARRPRIGSETSHPGEPDPTD